MNLFPRLRQMVVDESRDAATVSWLRWKPFRLSAMCFLFCLALELSATPVAHSVDNDVDSLTAAVKSNPDDATAHYKLGLAYQYHGHLGRAMEEYQAAINLRSDYADPHYELGLSLQYRGLYDDAVHELSEFVRLASPEDKKRLTNAQETIEYAKRIKKSKQEQREGVKLLAPFLLIVFPLLGLFLLGLAVKARRLSYILAGVHFVIVAPFTYYYVTALGSSMGMEMAIPMLVDIPLAIVWGVVANVLWASTDSQLTILHRWFTILCFPIAGSVMWFLVGHYWSKRATASRRAQS